MGTSDPVGEVITTRVQKVWLRADGLLQAQNISRTETTLIDAKAIVDVCRKLSGGRKRPIYIDTTLPAPLSSEAQDYYTSADVAQVISAIGILAPSWVGRMIGNFVISRQRKDVAMHLFENEATAVAWLLPYLG